MPRQNPNNQSPNPAKRFFQWDGSKGDIKYYNKETQTEERIALPFEFILLDRLCVIKGWHDASESGIYSNEVRFTADEPFTVRAFKMKEVIARGIYADIKNEIKAEGGKFNINLYIAYTDEEGVMTIGALTLHGAPMSAWIELERENKKALFEKGIIISGKEEGKKGGVTFQKPVFELVDIPPALDDQAEELQKELQQYLQKYLARKQDDKSEEDYSQVRPNEEEEDEIPF